MSQTSEDLDKEIEHQSTLLRSYQQNLRYLEEQIAMYSGSAPIHLLRQRDATNDELKKIQQKIQELEQQKQPSASGKPLQASQSSGTPIVAPQQNQSPPHQQPSGVDVLLVTVTEVEARAVLALSPGPRLYHIGDQSYHDLGVVEGAKIAMVQSEMGAGGQSGAMFTIQEAIDALHPSAVIMVGIAFGIDAKKQSIGDILISKQIIDYELQRVGTGSQNESVIIGRGDRPSASPRMLSRFRAAANYWQEAAQLRFGLVLSGAKLVDNQDFRAQLLQFGPEAVGGEMEGAGLYAAAQRKKVDWILVKGICDWADGRKEDDRKERQALAAANAARFTLYVISQGGFSSTNNTPSPAAPDSSNVHEQRQNASGTAQSNSGVSPQQKPLPSQTGVSVCIVYDDEDKIHKDRLEKHLAAYIRNKTINVWDTSRIDPARLETVEEQVNEHIDTARVILFLLSPSFSYSEECLKYVERGMARRKDRGTIVIPIYILPVDIPDAPFAGLLSLPRDKRPVSNWSRADDAWYNVAMDIYQVCKGLLPKV